MSGRVPSRRISIRQKTRPVPFRGERLRALVGRAARAAGVTEWDLRVLVVGDDEMARWNAECLGRPRTTNVISFPEEDTGSRRPVRLAGDILVSAPTCLRQTRGWTASPEERVLFFIVHGMMHLMGFDHERGREAAREMRRAEMKVYGTSVAGRGRH